MKHVRNEKRRNVDFSNVLHTALKDSHRTEEFFQSLIVFIASAEGQILSLREYGGLHSALLETVYLIQGHLLEQSYPYQLNDCIIDMIPIHASEDEEKCDGYLGMIVNERFGNEQKTTSYLLDLEQAVYQALRIGATRKRLEDTKLQNQMNQFQLNILKEVNYVLDYRQLLRSLVQQLEVFLQGDVISIIYQEKEEKFSPMFTSHMEILEMGDKFSIKKEDVLLLMEMDSNRPFLDEHKRLFPEAIEYQSIVSIPIIIKNKAIGVVVILTEEFPFHQSDVDMLHHIFQTIYPMLTVAYENDRIGNERKRRELLLQVTKKFHSSMDVTEVLREIVFAMTEMYPAFDVHLLLSHEWKVSEQLPIKPLQYGTNNPSKIAENVYLTGKIQIQDLILEKKSIIYAPLRGKQGVYGVMEIKSPHSVIFPTHEIAFIEMLADIAGNALENAQLYQQSRSLINDLQLINQTSHQLNSKLRLTETIGYMTEQIIQSFQAEQVGFMMFLANGGIQVMEGSTEYFHQPSTAAELEEICRHVKQEKEAIYVGDTLLEKVKFSLDRYRSVLIVPMIHGGDLKGMVLVLHSLPYHFTFENFKLLQSLIHHSTLAFTNAMLHEELEKLVITDHLTRLFARNYLDMQIQESMMKNIQGCFILIDIDNFKKINDKYGHQVGDDILIQVANSIKRNIREQDIAARWGGEELAVYLPETEAHLGYVVAERIVKSVEKDTSPKVTVSCGVSYWNHRDNGVSLKQLFITADKRLYAAKDSGKNKAILEI